MVQDASNPAEIPRAPAVPDAQLPPDERPDERGSLLEPNIALLTIHLREDLKEGKMQMTDLEEWSLRPWKAYEFLRGRGNDQLLDAVAWKNLHEWFHAADSSVDPLERDKKFNEWAQNRPEDAAHLREVILGIQVALQEQLKIYANTREELEQDRLGNPVENVLLKTKEYVVDEFTEHPITSAGVVLSGYMMYTLIKDKPAWKAVKWGASLSLLYAFVTDKFGTPTEAAAALAKKIGVPATALYELRDTIHRGVRAEGEGSLSSYLHNEIEIYDEYERALFDAFLVTNPKQFIEWYNAAKKWEFGTEEQPPAFPDDAAMALSAMNGKGRMPSRWSSLTDAEKTRAFLKVSDKSLDKMHAYSGSVSSTPIAYLDEKYVSGTYFDRLYAEWYAEWEREHPGMSGAMGRIATETKEITDAMRSHVIAASGTMTFLDVFMIELPAGKRDEIARYGGKGSATPEAVFGVLNKAAEMTAWALSTGYDYVTKTVPSAVEEVWQKDIAPRLPEMPYENFEDAFLDLGAKLASAKDATEETMIELTANIPTWEELKEAGIAIGEKAEGVWKMTKKEAAELWNSLFPETPVDPGMPGSLESPPDVGYPAGPDTPLDVGYPAGPDTPPESSRSDSAINPGMPSAPASPDEGVIETVDENPI